MERDLIQGSFHNRIFFLRNRGYFLNGCRCCSKTWRRCGVANIMATSRAENASPEPLINTALVKRVLARSETTAFFRMAHQILTDSACVLC